MNPNLIQSIQQRVIPMQTLFFGKAIRKTLPLFLLLCCLCCETSQALAANKVNQQLENEQLAIQAAVQKVAPSVVQVLVISGIEQVGKISVQAGPSTGLIVSPEGHLLTSSFYFSGDPASVLVRLPNGKNYAAKIIAKDKSRKLVLLKIDAVKEKLASANYLPKKNLAVGQWAIGVGRTYRHDQTNISVGILSAINRMQGRAIQSDAAISVTNYGGPLIDIEGNVLGIIVPMSPSGESEVAGAEWYDSGIGFAIPLAEYQPQLQRLKNGEDLYAGMLGVSLLTGNLHRTAALIVGIHPESPADKAGLKKQDVIIAINGNKIRNQMELKFQIKPRYAGETLRITVMRNQKEIELPVTLVEKMKPVKNGFLGVLPQRNWFGQNDKNGIAIREIYPQSPADKAGLKPNDRITHLGDVKITSLPLAQLEMNGLAPNAELKITYVRKEKTSKTTVTLSTMPTTNPFTKKLPVALKELSTKGVLNILNPLSQLKSKIENLGSHEKTGLIDLKLAEFPNSCHAYVPKNYTQQATLGVIVKLDINDAKELSQTLLRWKPICDRGGLILILPIPSQKGKWQRLENEYLTKLLEHVKKRFRTDPTRFTLMADKESGQAALLLALKNRKLVHSLILGDTKLPKRLTLPPNDTANRLSLYLISSNNKRALRTLKQSIQRWTEAGYSLSTATLKSDKGALSTLEFEAITRWLETLDRF